jgi:hypothetical protein
MLLSEGGVCTQTSHCIPNCIHTQLKPVVIVRCFRPSCLEQGHPTLAAVVLFLLINGLEDELKLKYSLPASKLLNLTFYFMLAEFLNLLPLNCLRRQHFECLGFNLPLSW